MGDPGGKRGPALLQTAEETTLFLRRSADRAADAPYTGDMFRRQFRGAAYHRRQHRIMLATASIGVVVVALGIAARRGEAVGVGLAWAVLFSLGGLHRHDWDAMDRKAGVRSPRR